MASIGFIGVGKLGQACAEMVAEVHDVVGYDVEPREPENFSMVDNLVDAVHAQYPLTCINACDKSISGIQSITCAPEPANVVNRFWRSSLSTS